MPGFESIWKKFTHNSALWKVIEKTYIEVCAFSISIQNWRNQDKFYIKFFKMVNGDVDHPGWLLHDPGATKMLIAHFWKEGS